MKDKNTLNRFRGKKPKFKKSAFSCKRLIVCGIVFALLISNFVPSLIFNHDGDSIGSIIEIKTHAANKDKYANIVYNEENERVKTVYYDNGMYNLNSIDSILDYSRAYFSFPDEHQDDIICLGYTQGNSTGNIEDFIALGTEDYPFNGTILIIGTSDSTLQIPEAFFDYVYDSVRFLNYEDYSPNDSSTWSDEEMIFERTTTANEPVLARNVIHDTNLGTATTWKVVVNPYSGNNYSTAGFIGEMKSGAMLELDITDNTTMNIVNNAAGANEIKDVGYVCGVMETGSSLAVKSITTSTNTSYSVTSAAGNAGGVVGYMKEGATLSLSCQMPNTAAAVTASGSNKFAGGIVGCNDGGSVISGEINSANIFSPSARYSIGNTVSGTGGSGGVFGYYRPVFTENSTTGANEASFDISWLQVGASTSSRMNANGTGASGGLFGLLANEIKTTVGEGAQATTTYSSGDLTITDTSASNSKAVVYVGHTDGDVTDYGGLVGKYTACDLSSSLNIENITVNANRTGGAYDNYGGGIGETAGGSGNSDNAVYVKFDNFNATVVSGNSTSDKVYGGLVAVSHNSFIDSNDVTLSSTSNFYGGGVIGVMEDGVLRMSGTTDLTGGYALVSSDIDRGQIVGGRDNSLIFAEDQWVLKRSTACSVDDIGSWGEVLRFDGKSSASSVTSETLGGNTVLTVNESDHTVEIASHTVSGGATTISSKADFAKVALCFQIEASENPYLSFENTWCNSTDIKSVDISLGTNIDLRSTGLTGFTRDNASSGTGYCVYSGKFNGNNKQITLATGEPYGKRGNTAITSHDAEGNGKIYRHKYNGLFGIVDGNYNTTDHTVKNLTIAGTIDICPKDKNGTNQTFYCGGFAARALDDFTATGITTTLAMTNGGNEELHMGRLVGEMGTGIDLIDISESTFGGTISGNNSSANTRLGGVIGIINHNTDATRSWNFTNVTLEGSIENTHSKAAQRIGGLIAEIDGTYNDNENHRMLTLDGVTVNGLQVSGSLNSSGSMGGLLGYSWLKTDVDLVNVTVQDKTVENQAATKSSVSITNNAAGNAAGIVYRATGRWDVQSLDIDNIKMTATNANSVGMIVNRGHYHSGDNKTFYTAANRSAIYLRLPSTSSYSLTLDGTGINASAIFDELCAYTCPSEADIMKNGNGIISINTANFKTAGEDGDNASGSYHAQTTYGAKPNPNSRYYYNLDALDNVITNRATVDKSDTKLTTDPKKLMSWGVNVYSCENLKQYFTDKFDSTIPNATYDMNGFSWYPVTLNKSMTVNGTFKLYNREFEGSEKKKSTTEGANAYWRTSLYDSTNAKNTQHYLMHNALFYNVESCTLSLGTVTLQGDVAGYTKSGSSASICGALVCGTVSGESTSRVGTVKMTGNGYVRLDGIEIYNDESTVEKATAVSDYAPLLINKLDSHSVLELGNVSTTTAYNSGTDTNHAATSLVGDAGNNSATDINIEFKKITLDARNNTGKTDTDLSDPAKGNFNSMYNTYNSIFTKATLLNSFSYESGSSGRYDYTWAEDWDTDNDTPHSGNVTYGKELGYDSTNFPKTGAVSPNYNSQYPDEEFMYSGENHTPGANGKYTNPISDSDTTHTYSLSDFRNKFLPYVYTQYNTTNKTYQLQVNHASAEASGCGTYDDPYIFNTGDDIEKYCYWINTGTFANGDKICIPAYTDGLQFGTGTDAGKILAITGTWHGDDGHVECTFNGTVFNVTVSGNAYTIAPDVMRKYLAGAYYKIDDDASVLEIDNNTNFTGFGATDNAAYRFRGVIYGNNKTIKNKTTAPFIYYSNGCVVKDLTISVEPTANIVLAGYQKSFDKTNKEVAANNSEAGNAAYGAVIARVMGGDTIIDNVKVGFSNMTTQFDLRAQYAQLVPVGGYIGVIVNGGVIFRRMSTAAGAYASSGLSDSLFSAKLNVNFQNIGTGTNPTTTGFLGNNAWLYVNPIIGRVINGFAVTEGDNYLPYENGTRVYSGGETNVTKYWDTSENKETGTAANNHVTLQNGTKHYSIADIKKNSSQIGISGSNITVDDGQAFFIMSLIINSGMSKKALGYNQQYFVSRSADYTFVGTSTDTDYNSNAKYDYLAYNATEANSYKTSQYGYLAKKYTDLSNNGNAGKLANTSDATITLTGDIYLPDGYKGIGNIFQNNDNYRIKATDFNGGGKTISQNTSYYYYDKDFDTIYLPNGSESSGLGLINFLNFPGTYKNLYLTGSVKADLINKANGNYITNKGASSCENNNYLCVGMLIGSARNVDSSNKNIIIDDLALKNIDVFGISNTGGLIGYLGKSDGKGSKFTLKYTIKTNAVSAYNSDEIRVHGRASTGGLVGKLNPGYVKVDMKNHTFNLTEVVCDNANTRGGNYYDYGVGGFIGMMRAGDNSFDADNVTESTNYFRNIVIGAEDKPQTVKCENTQIFTAGVVGIMNKCKGISIDNCTFYNLSVKAQFGAAGLVAFPTTYTPAKVTNTHLLSPMRSTIESTTDFAGGLIGSSDPRQGNDGSRKFTFDNCTVEGYTIAGKKGAGGVIGFRGSGNEANNNTSNPHNLYINNVTVSDCTVKSDRAAGGLIGEMNEPILGYNILAKNISLASYTENLTITAGNPPYVGYICGSINTKSENVTYADNTSTRTGTKPVIKFAGFSAQNITFADGMTVSTTGSCNYGDGKFGTDGYVVFADYTGTANDQNDDFANVATSGTNVLTQNVQPYVTTSPKADISSTQFLTSDGVGYTGDASSYLYTSIGKIMTDIQLGTVATRYSIADDFVTDSLGATATEDFVTKLASYGKLSSYQKETGLNAATSYDFPVLIVDEVLNAECTKFINTYLQFITNTTFDFASGNSSVFNIDFGSMIWDTSQNKFKYTPGRYNATTNPEGAYFYNTPADGKFAIDGKKFDNAETNGRFTLMDVQFYDPAGSGKIAYHVYVPIIVKKMLQYDFNTATLSGTNYRVEPYIDANGNTLIENIGNTVTMLAQWKYRRTLSEWQAALESGDNLLIALDKKLQLKMPTGGFPSGTQMILVDANNKNKYYSAASDTTGLITLDSGMTYTFDLSKFSDGATTFSPVDFNDMFEFTVTTANQGDTTKFSVVSEPQSGTSKQDYVNAGATVCINGVYYKPDANGTYDIHLAYKNGSSADGFLTENYYISFFTDSSATTTDNTDLYHLDFYDCGTFNEPSCPTAVLYNNHTHFLTGNIFTNNISFVEGSLNPDQIMSAVNNDIYAGIRSVIGINPTQRNIVKAYLSPTNDKVTVYQSLLVMLNKMELGKQQKGILTRPGVSVTNFNITRTDTDAVLVADAKTAAAAQGNGKVFEEYITQNYLELRNNINLRNYLYNSCLNNYNLAVQANVDLSYTDLGAQFPTRDGENLSNPNIGTVMGASSNISSTSTAAAYSKTASEVWSGTPYYTITNTNAILTLNSDDSSNRSGEYYQLGINELEMDADDLHLDNDGNSIIKLNALYDVSDLSTADTAKLMELTITIRKKADDYTEILDIDDYITNLILKDANSDSFAENNDITVNETADAVKYTYIIRDPRTNLQYDADSKTYQIPITFTAYSAENFTGQHFQYSNYMINLNARLYNSYTASNLTYLDGSNDDDHVIWTNAKIIYNVF